ncbi:MAG TPA: hypothetical protein PK358_01745 [Spirochaetota bacterium]|nr:hypothetical protein [Spirochaetota bacterium]HPJ33526.1 hypothetical protein [Spirochaetota bacterium]
MNPLNLFSIFRSSHGRKHPSCYYENLKDNHSSGSARNNTGGTGNAPVSAAELFRLSPDYNSFKDALIMLQGNFAFETDDMLELGAAYFEKYPDNFNSSTAETIHLGYRIARISLIEKMIREIPPTRKHYYRKMYYKSAEIDNIVSHIIKKYGKETIYADFVLITTSLDILYLKICSMHAGMIKERYTGGISIFFNIAYLLRIAIQRHSNLVM